MHTFGTYVLLLNNTNVIYGARKYNETMLQLLIVSEYRKDSQTKPASRLRTEKDKRGSYVL